MKTRRIRFTVPQRLLHWLMAICILSMPEPIKLAANLSQYIFYVLMIGMPLIGWAMLSAASYPVALFGSVHLPPILPLSPSLHTLLWHAHYYLAFAFFALILMHVSAILFHKLIRSDGVFETMATVSTQDQAE
jgi:cytochrome b561